MSAEQYLGAQSVQFSKDIYVLGRAAVVGSKEGEGPLRGFFDGAGHPLHVRDGHRGGGPAGRLLL